MPGGTLPTTHWPTRPFVSDDSQIAQCTFRHSNALGGVIAQRRSGDVFEPDRQRATRYAELTFEGWGRV